MGKLPKIGINAPTPRYHNNVPTGSEQRFIEPIDLPQTATHTITNHRMSQLFAGGNAHPIGGSAVRSTVKHQVTVGMTGGGVQPPKNMIQLQRTGKFHTVSPSGNPKTIAHNISGNGFKRDAVGVVPYNPIKQAG